MYFFCKSLVSLRNNVQSLHFHSMSNLRVYLENHLFLRLSVDRYSHYSFSPWVGSLCSSTMTKWTCLFVRRRKMMIPHWGVPRVSERCLLLSARTWYSFFRLPGIHLSLLKCVLTFELKRNTLFFCNLATNRRRRRAVFRIRTVSLS